MSQQQFLEGEPDTNPETPVAKAATEAPSPVEKPSRAALVRAIVIDGVITAGLTWAALRGFVTWGDLAAWLGVAFMTQAKPKGPALETALRALGPALQRLGRK